LNNSLITKFLLLRYQETAAKMSNTRDSFGVIPSTAQVKPEDFIVKFPQTEIDGLRSLIAASRIGPETYEGLQPDRKYGIDAHWLQEAKDFWLNQFGW
jgi:microsomal epoxide hydrolase